GDAVKLGFQPVEFLPIAVDELLGPRPTVPRGFCAGALAGWRRVRHQLGQDLVAVRDRFRRGGLERGKEGGSVSFRLRGEQIMEALQAVSICATAPLSLIAA